MRDKLINLALVVGTFLLMGVISESLLTYLTPRDENIVREINDLGYRGPLPPREKTENVFRIIVVGDSFTFGSVVPYEATYPFQLEELLNETGGKSLKYEVINLGYPAYDPVKELAVLEKVGFDYQPDLVIIGYNLNDVSDITPPSPEEKNSLLMKLMKRSRLFLNGYFAIRRWLDPSYAGIIGRSGDINDMYKDDNPNWIKCRQVLMSLIQKVQDHHASSVVVILPHLRPFGDRYPFQKAVNQVQKFCRESQIPVVNILPLLHDENPKELQAHRLDAHPNKRYYQIVANALNNYIVTGHLNRNSDLQRSNSPWLVAGLASDQKFDIIPYGGDSP